MKSLMVIIDGLGDELIPQFDYKTPFDYARHQYIDELAKKGASGTISICGKDFAPESLKCILRLLGVSDKDLPRDRAYLELLAHHRDISEHEMVLRCNLISTDAVGRIVSSNAHGLSVQQMHEAALAADKIEGNIEFIHLSSYKNLLIMDKQKALTEGVCIAPPHESNGKNINVLLSEALEKSLSLKCFLKEARQYLAFLNSATEHYELYPWAVSERTDLPSFSSLHQNIRGAAVCATEIVKGIADGLKMERPEVNCLTGETDTDITLKAQLTLSLLKRNDFVLTHFNGSDEAGHRKDPVAKASFVERIDTEFFALLLANWREPLRIFLSGDHGTSSLTGKHLSEPSPFVAAFLNCTAPTPQIATYQDVQRFMFARW